MSGLEGGLLYLEWVLVSNCLDGCVCVCEIKGVCVIKCLDLFFGPPTPSHRTCTHLYLCQHPADISVSLPTLPLHPSYEMFHTLEKDIQKHSSRPHPSSWASPGKNPKGQFPFISSQLLEFRLSGEVVRRPEVPLIIPHIPLKKTKTASQGSHQ